MLSTTNVPKDKLLKHLEENKAKHVAEYEEAVAEYRAEAEKTLRKRAIAIRDGETLSTRFDLPEPVSYEAEYDRAIQQATWADDKVLALDEHTFRAWVLDEWDWQHHFAANTQAYAGAARRRK